MANIVDYLSDKVTSATNRATASVKSAYNEVVDTGAKALNPPKQQMMNRQTGKRFETNKYKSDQYSYPSDLMSSIYGGNYAIFYINLSDASRLELTQEDFVLNTDVEARMRGSLVANFQKLTGQVEKTAEELGNVNTEAVKNAVPYNARSQRRLKTAIALHVPNQLSVTYATSWGEQGTSGTQALMQAGTAVFDAINTNGAAVKKNMTDIASVGAEAGFAMGLSKLPPGVGAAAGLASNPKKEQVFEGVEFRKFTFDYQFYPRDEFEAENVLNIIHQFKLHMHPEFKSDLNYVWIYPSEFDITYYSNGVENTNIHQHTSCVLTNMTINYTPNGNFSVFRNGMPTQINISLEFKELQLASKESIGMRPGGGL